VVQGSVISTSDVVKNKTMQYAASLAQNATKAPAVKNSSSMAQNETKAKAVPLANRESKEAEQAIQE
jgi:predicted RND superfamily exporter protein